MSDVDAAGSRLLLAKIWMNEEVLNGGRLELETKLISEVCDELDKFPFERTEISELAVLDPGRFCDKILKRLDWDVGESWLLERIDCRLASEPAESIPLNMAKVIWVVMDKIGFVITVKGNVVVFIVVDAVEVMIEVDHACVIVKH